MINNGSLIISLDFEMMWGCHDWSSTEKYGRTNIQSVRLVIDRMLELFTKYDIHVTFATVGLVFCKDKDEVLNSFPSLLPSYNNINVSPYKDNYIENIKDEDSFLYFAPEMLSKLSEYSNIEIGSHTYSHYFCWEKGQTKCEFEADTKQMVNKAFDFNVSIKSIVFPKNQINNDYLDVCKDYGVICYRGNPLKSFDEPKNIIYSLLNKVTRLLDSYFNINGYSSFILDPTDKNLPINIQASRFLRPYNSKFSFLERLRLKRIKNEMIYAAKNNEVYHLWWHPHNFGANMKENLSFLEEILKCYGYCQIKYNMKSFTMSELTNEILKLKI